MTGETPEGAIVRRTAKTTAAFALPTAALTGNADLAPRLTPTTDLADLNLGGGWQPGRITIRDGSDNAWTVNLGGAVTVQDVIDTINTATGGAVTDAYDDRLAVLDELGAHPALFGGPDMFL